MKRIHTILSVLAIGAVAGLLAGCQPGGVGDPCIPEDEYLNDFNGFSVDEVNVESRSFQCETRVCLVNHFQGRTTCPYGNKTSDKNAGQPNVTDCWIPNSQHNDPVDKIVAANNTPVAVDPQLLQRRANDTVYCSCRCDGPDSKAKYCSCPSGFSCTKLVDQLGGLNKAQLAGSYCIKESTEYIKSKVVLTNVCQYSSMGDGNSNSGDCGRVDAHGAPL